MIVLSDLQYKIIHILTGGLQITLSVTADLIFL